MGKALVQAAFGARGTGKTGWVVQQCAADARLLVWDFKGDPRLRGIGDRYTDLAAAIRALQAPRFRVHYVVNQDRDVLRQFDLFCMAAWQTGRLRMFVDELPEVTKSNGGPRTWRKCVNVGRDYEHNGQRLWLGIIAAAQRPPEVDKSFIGNCDVIHTGRLGNPNDAKVFAAALGCDARELATMPDLHWIEKRVDRIDLARGVLSFGNAKAPPAKKVSARRKGP